MTGSMHRRLILLSCRLYCVCLGDDDGILSTKVNVKLREVGLRCDRNNLIDKLQANYLLSLFNDFLQSKTTVSKQIFGVVLL
jgi:hypothetical protein